MHSQKYIVVARFFDADRYCGEVVVTRDLSEKQATAMAAETTPLQSALVAQVRRALGVETVELSVVEDALPSAYGLQEAAALLNDLIEQDRERSYAELDDQLYMRQQDDGREDERLALLTQRAVIRGVVNEIIGAGFLVRVWDGNTVTVGATRDRARIMAAIGRTSDETLYVRTPDPQSGLCHFGWVELGHGVGNSAIRSYSPSLEQVLSPALSMALALSIVQDQKQTDRFQRDIPCHASEAECAQ